MSLTKVSYSMVSGAPANVLDFGADSTGVADSSAAIIAALAASKHVVVPIGTYRCDTMIELNLGKTLQLMGGATLIRKAAHSVSVEPVVWMKGADSSFYGSGQATSNVFSENRAPRGVVSLGHKDMTESHADVTYCTLKDMTISGAIAYGQTTGQPDAALFMCNPQFTELTSYFHNVTGIRVQHANIGIWMLGWANGNTISNIQGYKLGNTTLGVNRNVFIACSGALDNAISNVFFHQSPDSIGLLVEDIDNSPSGGTVHIPQYNSFSGMVFEQGGAAALSVKCISATTGASFYEIRNNTAGGSSLPSNFEDNNVLIDAIDVAANTGNFKTSVARTAFETAGEIRTTGNIRYGDTGQYYAAQKVKISTATNAASVSFVLSNGVFSGVSRLGFVWITVSGADNAGATAPVAWFLYRAIANGAAFPTVSVLKDSGGDTGSFTVTDAGSGVINVTSTQDNMVCQLEYAFPGNGVNVT